jgi:hypothetical protein
MVLLLNTSLITLVTKYDSIYAYEVIYYVKEMLSWLKVHESKGWLVLYMYITWWDYYVPWDTNWE